MVNYRRSKTPGALYFFTVTLRNRQSNLLITHINDLRHAMKTVQIQHPYKIEAIAILPDHLHTIWQLPKNDNNYSLRWQRIKGIFTRRIIKKGMKIAKNHRGEYPIWQRRFWEHTIRNENDFENHVNYIHHNPIKHGLVKKVKDWPYSSLHKYIREGLLPPGWSEDPVEIEDTNYGE